MTSAMVPSEKRMPLPDTVMTTSESGEVSVGVNRTLGGASNGRCR